MANSWKEEAWVLRTEESICQKKSSDLCNKFSKAERWAQRQEWWHWWETINQFCSGRALWRSLPPTPPVLHSSSSQGMKCPGQNKLCSWQLEKTNKYLGSYGVHKGLDAAVEVAVLVFQWAVLTLTMRTHLMRDRPKPEMAPYRPAADVVKQNDKKKPIQLKRNATGERNSHY